MTIGARTAAWSGENSVIEFLDGYYWVNASWAAGTGTMRSKSGFSCIPIMIPVQPSVSITFWWGSTSISEILELYLGMYKDGVFLQFYGANGKIPRTVTVNANANALAFNVVTDNKMDAFLYDNTNKRYLVKDGILVNGGGYKLTWLPRVYTASCAPSARFCALPRWEVAA